jgi:hypothetical protein
MLPIESAIFVCEREVRIRGRALRIARSEGDGYRFLDKPETLISGLRNCRTRIDLFTFIQALPDSTPKHKYPMNWDNAAVLAISTFDAWWKGQIDNKTRNMVRKGEKKGLTIREVAFDDNLVRGIWEIYNECPIRQGKRFPHYGMTQDRVREHAGTFLDCSVFLGAFFDGALIGFAKLTMNETCTQAGFMHIVSMIRHREKAPTNALIAQAVRTCATRKIPYLVYSQFAYGNKRRDSLSDFKERNGFQRVDIPRYYVPLTPFGKLAFRLGLHRSLIEWLPESLITILRDYRAAWYAKVPLRLRAS